jgi:hypothetical protein
MPALPPFGVLFTSMYVLILLYAPVLHLKLVLLWLKPLVFSDC